MLESTDPEIDVPALMRRVRQLAHADPAASADGTPDQEPGRRLAALPTLLPPPPMPPGRDEEKERGLQGASDGQPGAGDRFTTLLSDLVARAESKTRVGPGTPGFLRPLRRNQGGFNGVLLEIVQELVEAHSSLSREVGVLRGEVLQQARQLTQQSLQLDGHHAWIEKFLGAEAARQAWAEGMRGVAAQLAGRVVEGEQATRGVRTETAAIRELVQAAAVEAGRVQREWPGWQARVEDLATGQAAVAARCLTLEGQEEAVRSLHVNLSGLSADLTGLRGDLDALRAESEGQTAAHGTTVAQLEAFRDETSARLDALRGDLDTLGQTAAHGTTVAQLEAFRDETSARLDALRGDLDTLGQTAAHGTTAAQVEAFRDETSARLDALRGDLDTLHAEINALGPPPDVAPLGQHLRNLQGEVDRLRERTDEADSRAQRLREHLGDLQGRTEGLGLQVGASRVQELRFEELHANTNRAGEHLRTLQGQADGLREALDVEIHARESLHAAVTALPRSLEELRRDLDRLDERQIADGSFLKAELALNRRPASLIPAADASSSTAAPGEDGAHALDAFYVAFENEFRGSRDLVRERLKVYLPDLERVGAGSEERPVLDLGCGRGEWLELLRENGHAASRGVDLNAAMVAECQARGLDVQTADAVAFLRGLPAESLGAVTAFHLIEHVPFEILLELLAQTHRVLRPGGLAIFESPNCKNLVVGSCNFYSDPTHRNPVFPDTAGFMLRSQGFARAEVRYLRPVEGSPFDPTRPDGAALHGWLYGPRDFAVLGHKGGGSPAEPAGA